MAILAHRSFEMRDQRAFALASGDYNPIHVDPLAARRTQAGAPVVHGIHLLLWALDAFAASHTGLPPLRSLRARFKRMVYLEEPVSAVVSRLDAGGAHLSAAVDGAPRSEFELDFGVPAGPAPQDPVAPAETFSLDPQPRDWTLEQIAKLRGRIPLQMSAEQAAAAFPAATSWLGAHCVRSLAATSHLVGMICPGLHSLYSEVSLRTHVRAAPAQPDIIFRVVKTDPRYGWVTEEVIATDFSCTLRAFLRPLPVGQPTMQSLLGTVTADEFAGSLALIVGGSRGLGEFTAKLVATGGGRVLITWQSGEADALRVAEEIRSAGGQCDTLRFDARDSAAAQLSALEHAPTHAYYFATPLIGRPRTELYSARRLAEFLGVYVEGFWQLTQALRTRRAAVSLFYPSSVFVTERPPGMTEYAMAKAAGESLCADINAQLAPTRVTTRRLPRLPTDQTASQTPVRTENALQVLLPVVRAVQQPSAQ